MLSFIQGIDTTTLNLMLAIQGNGIKLIMESLTFLGNPVFWFLIAALIYWLGEENESVYLTTLVLFAAAIAGIIKTIVHRPRPQIIQGKDLSSILPETTYNKYSFPSGHATMISAAFAYFREELSNKTKIIFALIVLLVMFSRLYLGKHYLTDVIGGLILGLIIGAITQEIRERYAGRKFNWQGKKVLIITLFITALIILLIISAEYSYALVFLGYFAGFLLFKRFNLKIKRIQRKKQLIERMLLGVVFLSFLGAIIIIYSGLIAGISLALIGLWVSIIYPVIIIKYEKRKDLKKVNALN